MDRESGKRHGCVGNGMKKRKTKEREREGGMKKKKSGTYSRKVTFFEAATCFHRVSGSPARKMLGLPRCVAT